MKLFLKIVLLLFFTKMLSSDNLFKPGTNMLWSVDFCTLYRLLTKKFNYTNYKRLIIIYNKILYTNEMRFLYNYILLDMPLHKRLMLSPLVRTRLPDARKVFEGTGVKWGQFLSAKVESKLNRI